MSRSSDALRALSLHGLLRAGYGAVKRLPLATGALRLLRRALPERVVVPLREAGIGFRFALHPRVGGDFGIILSHERHAKAALKEIVRPGQTAFDIGAHYGVYTLLLAGLVGARGRVIAFEPHPYNLGRLRENVAVNRLANVGIVEKAVSDRSGVVRFNFGNSSAVSSLKDLEYQRADWHDVEATTVDEEAERLASPIALVKIDVEGAEDLVLRGMRRTLREQRPALLLELHVHSVGPDAAVEIVEELLGPLRYAAQLVYLRRRGERRERRVDPSVRWEAPGPLLRIILDASNAGLLLTPRPA